MVPGLVYYTTADRFISNETKRIRVGTRPEVGGAIGSLGEVVAMWLIESLFYEIPIGLIGYTVARLILPPLSGHRIYVQPLWSSGTGFNTLGYRYDDDGRIEIESTPAGFLGFIIFLILFFSFGLLIRAAF
jgi:hypothetical protein